MAVLRGSSLGLVTDLARTKFLLLGLILVLATCAVIRPISAIPTVTVSNSGNIVVAAGQSGSTLITFHVLSIFEIDSVTISCSGLPADATCSTNPASLPGPWFDGTSFDVVVNTSPSTPAGAYPITVTVFFTGPPTIIQPSFLVSSSGSIGPESVTIQASAPASPTTTFTLTVDPAVIPEYPLGLAVLAIFMIIAYGVIRRKTRND